MFGLTSMRQKSKETQIKRYFKMKKCEHSMGDQHVKKMCDKNQCDKKFNHSIGLCHIAFKH